MSAKRHNVGTYLTVQKWMVENFGLHGDELLIYAIIYGFSQDGKSCYTGSSKYLRFWTGKSKETVLNNLKSLRKKNLIARKRKPNNSGNPEFYVYDYWATITRYPEEDQETIIHKWAEFSTTCYPQKDE